MTGEHLQVFVNDRPVSVYRGMKAKHALIALDSALCKAVQKGELLLQDENGFTVGLEGALHDGAKLYLKKAGR